MFTLIIIVVTILVINIESDRYEKVTGTLMSTKHYLRGNISISYIYEVNGKSYTGISNEKDLTGVSETNKTVNLKYEKENPQYSRIDKGVFEYFGGFIAGFITLALTIVCFVAPKNSKIVVPKGVMILR